MTYRGKLSQHDLETVVDWFMYHLPMEQRTELMADLPQQYAALTGATPEVIAERVLGKIGRTRQAEREQMAAELDGATEGSPA